MVLREIEWTRGAKVCQTKAMTMSDEDCKKVAEEIAAARRNANSSDEARVVLDRAESALQTCPDNWNIRTQLAWAIWEACIKQAPVGTKATDFAAAVDRIREVQPDPRYGPLSCYVRAVTDSLDSISGLDDRASRPAVGAILKDFDTSQLDFAQGIYKDKPQPSQAARFFSAATAALNGIDELVDLQVEICNAALSSGAFLDAVDAKWITYRLARATEDTDPARALALLEGLPTGARDVTMAVLFVRLLRKANRDTEALHVATEAVLGIRADRLKFSIGLLVDVAEMVASRELKKDIVSLVRATRLGAGWRPDVRAEMLAASLGLADAAELDDVSRAKLLNQIRNALR